LPTENNPSAVYNFLVVGCGYVGSAIAQSFRLKKQNVWGLIRSRTRESNLKAMGVTPIVADLTKPETLQNLPAVHFVILSPAPDERDEASYRSVYVDGIRHVLQAIEKTSRPQLVIYTSSVGVYGEHAGHWVDESTIPHPDSKRAEILLEAEHQVRQFGFSSIVLRLAGIYGPNRNRLQSVRSGELKTDKQDGYINLIHVDDIVRMIPVLMNRANTGEIILGVDNEPVLKSEFFKWLHDRLGKEWDEKAYAQKSLLRGKRCRSRRLNNIGFEFKYPTFREGYDSLLRN